MAFCINIGLKPERLSMSMQLGIVKGYGPLMYLNKHLSTFKKKEVAGYRIPAIPQPVTSNQIAPHVAGKCNSRKLVIYLLCYIYTYICESLRYYIMWAINCQIQINFYLVLSSIHIVNETHTYT